MRRGLLPRIPKLPSSHKDLTCSPPRPPWRPALPPRPPLKLPPLPEAAQSRSAVPASFSTPSSCCRATTSCRRRRVASPSGSSSPRWCRALACSARFVTLESVGYRFRLSSCHLLQRRSSPCCLASMRLSLLQSICIYLSQPGALHWPGSQARPHRGLWDITCAYPLPPGLTAKVSVVYLALKVTASCR